MTINRREAIKITAAAAMGMALPGTALVAPPAAAAFWKCSTGTMRLCGNTIHIKGSVTSEQLRTFLLQTGKGKMGNSGCVITQCNLVGDGGQIWAGDKS